MIDHGLSCRAFLVTKEITRTRLKLNMLVIVGSSPTIMRYVFHILELQFNIVKLKLRSTFAQEKASNRHAPV